MASVLTSGAWAYAEAVDCGMRSNSAYSILRIIVRDLRRDGTD